MKNKLIALLTLVLATTASAVTITNPLTLQTQYLVGIHNGQGANANISTEQVIAQTLLDMASNQVIGNFATNTIYDYNGTITSNGGQISTGFDGVGGVDIPAGWGGALAKYDGPNGGYVLYVFGGEASTIPEFPWNFWTTETDKYQISHYTLFSGTGGLTPTPFGVPEGGAGMALFGLTLLGMGAYRKLKS